MKIRYIGGWFDGDVRHLQESVEHPVTIPGHVVVLTEKAPEDCNTRILIGAENMFLPVTVRTIYRLATIGPDGVVEALLVSEERTTAGSPRGEAVNPEAKS